MNRMIMLLAEITIFFVSESPAEQTRLLTEVDIKPGENATAQVVRLHGYRLRIDRLHVAECNFADEFICQIMSANQHAMSFRLA